MGRTLHEVFRIREVRDHRTGGTVVALNPPDTGSNRDPERSVGGGSCLISESRFPPFWPPSWSCLSRTCWYFKARKHTRIDPSNLSCRRLQGALQTRLRGSFPTRWPPLSGSR